MDSKKNEEPITNSEAQLETVDEIETEEDEGEPQGFFLFEKFGPRWLRILLMFLPAIIIAATVILVDQIVGFPENINPVAIIAVTGLGLFGLSVISDLIYRNFFIYRLMMRENRKGKVYKEIIQERQQKKAMRDRYAEVDEEYVYDEEGDDEEEFVDDDEEEFVDDDEEEFVDDDEEYDYEDEEEEDEYVYDFEEEDEQKYYRPRSLILRGGLFTIIIVNALVLLGAAVILQLVYSGGFVTPNDNSTTT